MNTLTEIIVKLNEHFTSGRCKHSVRTWIFNEGETIKKNDTPSEMVKKFKNSKELKITEIGEHRLFVIMNGMERVFYFHRDVLIDNQNNEVISALISEFIH